MNKELYYSEQTLENMARRTIKEYDSLLLTDNPRAIPIEDIMENKFNLSIEYQYIRKNGRILGETVFEDDYVPIYDMEKGKYIWIFVKRGTIIIDASLLRCRIAGRLRFTCAHEFAHWLIHQKLYTDSGEVASMTKAAKKSSDDNKNIERQADFLGSSLLLPHGQVKMAFYRLRGSSKDIITELAQKFDVSKQAMEIHLKTSNLI